jgi:hypothetical protein
MFKLQSRKTGADKTRGCFRHFWFMNSILFFFNFCVTTLCIAMSLFRLFGKTEKIAKSDPKGCLGFFHGVGFGLYNLRVVSWGGGSGVQMVRVESLLFTVWRQHILSLERGYCDRQQVNG